MKSKVASVLSAFLLVIFFSIGSFVIYMVFFFDPYDVRYNMPQNPSDDSPVNLWHYQFDPSTILADLGSGKKDVFHPSKEDSLKDLLYPSGSFAWSQEDYLTIAKAHHMSLAGETFENGWDVFSYGRLYIDQCRDSMQGFDRANIIFYKKNPDGSFPVTYMIISPLYESIDSKYLEYEPRRYDEGFNKASVMNGKMTADDALRIAEAAGGRAMRHKLSNDGCDVNVTYYSSQYWRVNYWWYTDDLKFYLYYEIDSINGGYEVSRKQYKCERTICP